MQLKRRVEIFLISSILLAVLFNFIIDFSQILGACPRHIHHSGELLSEEVYDCSLKPESHLLLNFNFLEKDIRNYLNQNRINASVYVSNLEGEGFFEINEEALYPAASLNKLPTAMLILKKVENGEISLDTNLSILDSDRDSSSGTLYNYAKREISVGQLLSSMLQESDNTALWTLLREIKKKDFIDLADYLGFYYSDIDESTPYSNYTWTDVEHVSNAFKSLYFSTVLNSEDSNYILSQMSNSTFNVGKYSSLPKGVVVSQKDGFQYSENRSFFHDCGILYSDKDPILFCIMTKDVDEQNASGVIGTILNKVYSFVDSQDRRFVRH